MFAATEGARARKAEFVVYRGGRPRLSRRLPRPTTIGRPDAEDGWKRMLAWFAKYGVT